MTYSCGELKKYIFDTYVKNHLSRSRAKTYALDRVINIMTYTHTIYVCNY